MERKEMGRGKCESVREKEEGEGEGEKRYDDGTAIGGKSQGKKAIFKQCLSLFCIFASVPLTPLFFPPV